MAESAQKPRNVEDLLIVEAALFSAGKPLAVDEIAENTGVTRTRVKKALEKLATLFDERDTSLEIRQAGNGKWAMQVRTEYAPRTVRLAPMEVSPKVLKTLALIAYHQPILQSELMEMVGSKVYDHVGELKQLGLIRKRVHERSFMLVTTEKFPEYFGIPTADREEIKRYLAEKVGLDIPDRDRKGNKKLSAYEKKGAKKRDAEAAASTPAAEDAPATRDEAPAAADGPAPGEASG